MQPVLVCVEGGIQGQGFPVTGEGLHIGRDPANEVVLVDNDVSRAHARVLLHNSAVWVQDAGSRNGVFVNDKRVTDHKQVSPGDRVVIGSHVFTLELHDPLHEHSVSVDMRAAMPQGVPQGGPTAAHVPQGGQAADAEPAKKKWKIWPFVLVAVLALGCIGVIAVGGSGGATSDAGGSTTPVTKSKYSLSESLKGKDPGAASEEPAGEVGLTEALTAASGGAKDIKDTWPDPPKGASQAELVEAGHNHYQAGRLKDALSHYQMAVKADLKTECEICTVRITKLETEIATSITENFDSGMRYYDSLQYEQAAAAWEKVLLLDPDPESAVHQRTQDYLERARKKITRQY